MTAALPQEVEICARPVTREIPLTRGFVAIVDASDYERVIAEGSWYASAHRHTSYACRKTDDGVVYMHRFIMGAADGLQVDHRNRNGLDNTRHNLRPSSRKQNIWNAGARSSNSSGGAASSSYKGVHFSAVGQGWLAQIATGGHRLNLGYFHTDYGAALAYDRAAREIFREFAHLNVPVLPPTLDPRAVPRTGVMGRGRFSYPQPRAARKLPLTTSLVCRSCRAPLGEHDAEGWCHMGADRLPLEVEICARERDGGPCLGVIYRPASDRPWCYRCGATEPGVVYVKKDAK